ncbi:uroporphyrinogen III C2,C7-methyltransferase and uroporphyrinogen III synthase [Syntrophotalea carbinolica DSM 2380]|uniref:uroporphyrinogen-III C-methyltransferase n=1 Tax=Syntrophotalea carbinolica (strain DSM 2380 / NBRC 103641 / GraBd1) TaxID=338963 RepID=Q3A010_SYNC1|nr:uroporphyrinogen-III C-methyltransferase [Syntrophotalea carbinolica]ABA90297.1 uroporphyrinogen III C2,C7-methyltransferase and uroporphyrinogen III synthase [Syntrophotalea carbinolica DSM 2380]
MNRCENSATGIVYLVGAGPGDPGLLTVRGLQCLRRAEVVVYDYLANPQLLHEAPATAERIYVGKTAGHHHLPQEKINALLVEKARLGKVVVRLKGGDPCLFGRGGEEACELAEAGLPFEIVPGVTAGFGAAIYAGIPLTHRDYTTSLGLITGHEDPKKKVSSLDWSKLATGVGTLLFYMGMGNLATITKKLVQHGRAPDTPVAVVRWGTTPRQQTLVGTLADITERVQQARLGPPAIIVVGEIVALRKQLRWFDNRPLFGRRILVTRAAGQAGVLTEGLQAAGAEAICCPTLEIVPPPDWQELDAALQQLPGTDVLVLTSVNAVNYFFERLFALGHDSRLLHDVCIAAVGPKTAAALRQYGLRADLLPDEQRAEGVLEVLLDRGVTGKRILYPRSQRARDLLVTELSAAGAEVCAPVAYHTRAAVGAAEQLREALEQGVDAVTFASSSAVDHCLQALGDDGQRLLAGVTIASLGPLTSDTVRRHGLEVAVEAAVPTVEMLIEALQGYFGELEA